MTKLLDQAVETARAFSPDVQDDIAHAILALAQSGLSRDLIPEAHREAVLEGLRQAEARELASDADVEKALRSLDT